MSHRVLILFKRPVHWLLNERFLTALAAGAVNGTMAEPTGGSRTVVDTTSLLSLSGGAAVWAGGLATPAWGDPCIWWPAQTRVVGRALFGTLLIQTSGENGFGWDNNQSGMPFGTAFNIVGTSLRYNEPGANPTLGTVTAGVAYRLAVVIRSSGGHLLIKGGSQYPQWTRVAVGNLGTSTPLYPAFSNYNAVIPNITQIVVTDLPTPWTTDFGPASLYSATPPAVTPVLATTGGPLNDGELLTDPGLEAAYVGGLNPNCQVFGTGTPLESADVHGGTKAQQVTAAAQYDGAGTKSATTVVGKWYMGSIWGKGAYASFQQSRIAQGNRSVNYGYKILTTSYTQHARPFRALTTTSIVHIQDNKASAWGAMVMDDVSIKEIVLASMLTGGGIGPVDYLAEAVLTITPDGTTDSMYPVGLVTSANSLTAPTDYVQAYHDNTSLVVIKSVGGSPSVLFSGAVTYVAGARLITIKDGQTFTFFYNNALIYTATISDATIISNTYHSAFSTGATAVPTAFAVFPRFPSLPGYL